MSNVSAKNLMLSRQRGEPEEQITLIILPHTSTLTEESTEIRVEIPGVDPSTVEVSVEDHTLSIACSRGSLTIPVNQSVNVSKIKADILWGMLTLSIPLPEPPVYRTIKVGIHDPAPAPAKKPAAKTHVATEEE